MKKTYRLAAFFLLISLITSGLFSYTSPASGQSSVQATVQAYGLNVRVRAGADELIVGSYSAGTVVNIEGRQESPSADGLWVYTVYPTTGLRGWVLATYLKFPYGFDTNSLPISTSLGQRATIEAPATDSATTTTETSAPVSIEGALSGLTTGTVNFRNGPSTSNAILRTLPASTLVAVVGRNSDNTWFQGVLNGQTGWLYYTLISINGDINALPVTAQSTQPNVGSSSGTVAGSTMSGIITNITSRSRQIFAQGQALGNRANVFSKVGDSISHANTFLTPIGVGGLQIHGYTSLQPVIDYYMTTPARTNNSFANSSLATGGGWTTRIVLDPAFAMPGVCQPGESPLVCEYRVVKPAVALIMFGTNDAGYLSDAEFVANLQTIVQTSIDMGVIPVLSSIPDNLASSGMGGRALHFNSLIRSVAVAYRVPFWDYWSALQTLPNKGIGGDGVHPSINPATFEAGIFSASELQYGMNMRNLTALMVLDAIWRQVLS